MEQTARETHEMTEDEVFAAGLAGDSLPASASPPPPEAPEPPSGDSDGGNDTDAQGVDNSQNPSQPDLQDAIQALPEEIRNRIMETESANRKLQEELARSRNDHASMAGKLRPLQQKLAKLERAETGATAAPPVAMDAPQTAEELDASLETPEFKEWAAVFPEEAKVWRANQRQIIKVAEKIAERRVSQAVAELNGRITPIVEREEEGQRRIDMQERIAALEAVHPDWRKYSESDEFSDWFNTTYLPSLPDEIQDQFADPAAVSRALSQPNYAARILTEFKRDTGIDAVRPPPSKAAPAAAAPAQGVPARLALSAAPSVSAPPPRSRVGIEHLTPDQAFQAGLNSTDY